MFLTSLINKLQCINEYVGRLISWLSIFMVLITFTIVVLRYGFNMGWIAMQESVMYMYATSFLLGIAYTYKHEGHVRVDIFYNKMSVSGKAWVNLFGIILLLLPMTAFIFYSSWGYVMDSWSVMEESGAAGGLAFVYLLKTNILLMAVLLAIEALAQILINIKILFLNNEELNDNDFSNNKLSSDKVEV
jgi:TRAP-type mannitol/chloroaromatic compound transport system permease small subunit